MFNSTIFALVAGSLAHSPLITVNNHQFRSISCTFSYLISPAFYSSYEMKSFLVDHSTFRNIIGNGIILESKSYLNEVFEKSVIEKSQAINIQSCLFINCTDSMDNGGGIQVSSQQSSVEISNTGFTNCRTTANGGAFYVISKQFVLDQCCITSCSADEYDAFYFSNLKFNNDVVNLTHIYSITPSDSSTSVVFIYSDRPTLSKNNITSIKRNSIRGIFEFDDFSSIVFQYNSFVSCAGKSILYFNYFTGDIANCNFDNNKANNLAYFVENNNIKFCFCCFMNDNSRVFSNQYCHYLDCVFDHPRDEDKFANNDLTLRCTFDSKYTTNDIDIPNMSKNGCWALISNVITEIIPVIPSSDSGSSSLNATLYSVIIIAMVIVICILLFFIIRWWKNRRSKDYMLTMYAQV